jgi:hypothetical protein
MDYPRKKDENIDEVHPWGPIKPDIANPVYLPDVSEQNIQPQGNKRQKNTRPAYDKILTEWIVIINTDKSKYMCN